MWAEDGAVFLADAYRSNLLTGAFTPYNGYALLQPRVLAELISWAPLTWQGQLMSVIAALCQALVALLAFHVVRAHARTRIPPVFLVALVVAAVPVGVEVIDNLANGQVVPAGGRRPRPTGAPCTLARAGWPPQSWSSWPSPPARSASSPPRWPWPAGWWTGAGHTCRSRFAGLTGAAIQVWVAVHAPPRSGPLNPGLDVGSLVGGVCAASGGRRGAGHRPPRAGRVAHPRARPARAPCWSPSWW